MKNNIDNRKKGFSLIEVVVSLGIFAIAALIGVSSFLSLAVTQRKVINIQSTYDNLRYSIEVMAKEIRTGDTYYCGVFSGTIATLAPNDCRPTGAGAQALTFINSQGIMISYRYSTAVVNGQTIGILQRQLGSAAWEQVSGNDVNLQDFRFFVTGSLPSAGETPPFQAVITVVSRGISGSGRSTAQFSLETTVTQRSVR